MNAPALDAVRHVLIREGFAAEYVGRILSEAEALSEPITAGRSDKYGQVYVERIGNTGFPDPDEPVALLRAQDRLAYRAMLFYQDLINSDPDVSAEQRDSVSRQVARFHVFQACHPNRVRTPGAA